MMKFLGWLSVPILLSLAVVIQSEKLATSIYIEVGCDPIPQMDCRAFQNKLLSLVEDEKAKYRK
jgi:predicted aminopeptidase